MMRSMRFVWATCLSVLVLTLFLVTYTSTQSMSVQLKFNITPLTQQQKAKNSEKYITFLPHSGLHNQRIGLLNALLLAKSLNRTLILPEINIGTAVWWRPNTLAEFRLSECPQLGVEGHANCKDFKKYVPVSVESIFDLSAAHAQGIRTIQRSSMSQDYFKDVMGLKDPEDIYRLQDNSRYSYRIYDSEDNQDDIRTFAQRVEMNDLRQLDQKVIMFGSLHYTLRVAYQDPAMIWLANHLREEISIAHPVVIRQALSVIPLLGGPETFVGVHLRQGDGYFKALMDETVNTLRATLEQPELTQEQIIAQQQSLEPVPFQATPLTMEDETKIAILKSLSADNRDLLNQCVAWHSQENHPRLRLIFMATDTPQPRTTLKDLYDEFPCIFTLSDFPEVIESTLSMSPMLTGHAMVDEEMKRLDTTIASLLFPMIDAEIASHGSIFIGTRKSTFSQYINFRYNRFQSMYHTLP
ncbi:hypothetical protein A0J61_11481 [Choanephora cucurbitarum]|uniref:Uncharacterized protein n=2 Tax=Choanephora cucurbitarum TaxID=101091 RepID=A0A1C7MUI0_9FUNG|nr:hypothetical protein A0J61_11481 [Choanephora cucurbitarum]